MTQEEASRFWPIIKAYAEGQQIEFKDLYNGKWYLAKNPNFTNAVNTYRIKEEPIYRPFKDANECWEEMKKHEPFGWVKSLSGVLFNVFEIGKSYIVITQSGLVGYDKAVHVFVFADGTPFGKRED